MRQVGRGLILVGVKLEPETYARLEAFATQEGLKPGAAGRALLSAALEGDTAARTQEELRARGYREGLRAAAHQVRDAIAKILKAELE